MKFFETIIGHQILIIFLKLLFTKVWSPVTSAVIFLFTNLYKNIVFTFNTKVFSLVFCDMSCTSILDIPE